MLHPLKLHPDYRCAAVSQISVDVTRNTKVLMLRYIVKGETGSIRIPARVEPARTNGLWRNTCFEVFVKVVSAPRHGSSSDGGYWEFNFSPSTQWAAYSFTGRREGMAPFDIVAPGIESQTNETCFELATSLDLAAFDDGPWTLGLSAVIEETNGSKSYWALRHPKGQADFHHADCFALSV